ncbi:ABC transporter ATP-binding protein [Telluribacter humicola]|uniref:ABC transporter ATP-binding protein n=1 Tax=Telluribacter humicola TaxID=1720261 RepID=UPI001A961864|nr:ABC transporter ATP-binding protein [Telluribacter humicola]
MIQLDNVSFGYNRRKQVFENLNMQLSPGHIYGLLGKNGAGKSSLLRLIAGLLFPSDGQIVINRYKPRKRQPAFLQDVFFIPEEVYLPAVSIDRYLAIMAPFYPQFDEALFRRYIEEFEIPDSNRLTEISHGQKKKAQIAFALAANTKVLLMDEPTNGLDIPSKSQFRRIVSAALNPDRLILISTHQVRDLDHLIDSIIILNEYQVLMQHSLEAVTERLYFGTRPTLDGSELYSEPALRGYKTISENLAGEESRVDLEQLFNAVTTHPLRIRDLFQKEPTYHPRS